MMRDHSKAIHVVAGLRNRARKVTCCQGERSFRVMVNGSSTLAGSGLTRSFRLRLESSHPEGRLPQAAAARPVAATRKKPRRV